MILTINNMIIYQQLEECLTSMLTPGVVAPVSLTDALDKISEQSQQTCK